MKYHRGGDVFCFDNVPINRIIREYNQFNEVQRTHLKFLAAIQGLKI